MSRDNNGRLRRKSWLASKRSRRLRAQLQIFMVYRNYVRQRFNRDADRTVSSASWLGIVPRAMRISEVMRWRQDWGKLSPHPLSYCADKTVAEEIPDSV
ncbi:MAG: hypothetical protein NXI31_19070 [bacterium]|nr:hypothetical protein [bacterium]